MKIQVLGSGCPTCKKLYESTKQVAEDLGISDPVEYISGSEGVQKIIELGAMSSPLLVIDGEIKLFGAVDSEKLKQVIKESKGK